MATMTGPRTRTAAAAVLQALALAALLLALAGVGGLDDRARPGVLVLVDRSLSVPRPVADAALAELRRAAPGGRLEAIAFAGRPARPDAVGSGAGGDAGGRAPSNDIEPSATNLERALDAALAASAQRPYAALVIVSDGRANAGDAARALASARDAGLPVLWLTAARSAPRAWIADVQAPARARRGQPIAIAVPVAGDTSAELRVTATLRDAAGAERTVSATPDAHGLATLRTTAERDGPLRISLSLADAGGGEALDARRDAAVVDVLEPARLLYLRGSPGPLAESLANGGWDLETAPARRAPDFRERLGGYEAVVLDDVAREDAGDGFWQALAGEVRTRGLGLLVLGGERAFARGGYRDSPLEVVLPVLSEPASLDPPASVVFAVDKSGSMGEGSRGVDRLSLAERAVLETLGTLGERDAAGVVAFDVEPRLLQPLQPAATLAGALAGSWPIVARGGTRLAPAIELAAGQLEQAGPGRRILVVVTDGFVDDAPLEALRRRLEASRIETVALAVGPDADAAALERLAGRGGGAVLRVGEAAQLPAMMRAGLDRRRARVERGVIEVRADALPASLAGLGERWPPITAYAVTRLRPEATAWLRSGQGDTVIAAWQTGAGRVVAVTSGLGAWTLPWLRWEAWPRLAGGLADWVVAAPGAGTSALRVSDLPEGLRVELDAQRGGRWSASEQATLTVTTPTGRTQTLALEPLAPGRMQATLEATEPGPYALVASGAPGVRRTLHLRGGRGEEDGWGESPDVERWMREGLVQRWEPGTLAASQRHVATGTDVRPDRWLLGLALLLACAGILADRLPGGAPQAAAAAWRAIRRACSRSSRPKPSRS